MMISIIICSRSKTIHDTLLQNIKDSVGCDYELIVIDNSQNTYSIFEAYNLGIKKSRSEYLCLIHDDILFHTECWGTIITNIFESDKKIGLVGVAGAKVKTKIPSAWWDCPEKDRVLYIVQHLNSGEIEKWEIGWGNKTLEEVVAIDGVFMAMRKDQCIQFNTVMKGFHNYDLNISFEYKKQGYKVIVTNEISIEHYSIGKIDKEWVESAYKVHKIYKYDLPLKVQGSVLSKGTEVTNAIKFIKECLTFKKYNIAYSIWLKLFCLYFNSKYHIEFWKRILKEKLC